MKTNPYAWLNITLGVIALCFLAAAVLCAILALLRRRGSRKQFVWASLICLCATASAIGANYGLFYFVELPFLFPKIDLAGGPGTLTRIGERCPEFTFATLDGTQVRSSDLKGKTVLINFFATWCGPCLLDMPHLQEIWNEFQNDSTFAMFVIGREESDKTIAEFNADGRYTFPFVSDPDKVVYKMFADEFIPRTYVISSDGVILLQTHGFAESDMYQSELTKIKKTLRNSLKR